MTTRRFVLSSVLVVLLGMSAGCGEDPKAEERGEPAQPNGPATVTVTASPVSPSPTATPSKTPRTAPTKPPKPAPAPVNLSRYDMPGLTTPSGNIGCLFDDYQGAHVRCDRLEMNGVPSRKPADCEFDWGHSVELYAGDRAALACTSDSVMGIQGETDGTRALPYGDSVRYRGIVCTSMKQGLSCKTKGGHGFLISRATIHVR